MESIIRMGWIYIAMLFSLLCTRDCLLLFWKRGEIPYRYREGNLLIQRQGSRLNNPPVRGNNRIFLYYLLDFTKTLTGNLTVPQSALAYSQGAEVRRGYRYLPHSYQKIGDILDLPEKTSDCSLLCNEDRRISGFRYSHIMHRSGFPGTPFLQGSWRGVDRSQR